MSCCAWVALPNIRLCPLNRLGTIRARRSEPGARGVLDEAIDTRRGGEPQSIVPVRWPGRGDLLDGKAG